MAGHRGEIDTSNFKPHDGSACPVDVAVRVLFRSGIVAIIDPDEKWVLDPWVWCDPPSGFDIVAYEI